MPAMRKAVSGSSWSSTSSGSPPDRMMLDCASTIARSASGTPIMSQMTRSGIGAAMSATTSMVPSPASAFRRAAASTSATISRTESSTRSSIRGVKVLDDQPADLGVPGVVHADHRAVELVEVGRDVLDGHRALAGAEDRRLGADGLEVGVAGDRPVAGAGLEHRHLGLGEEGERPFPAERVEHRVPLGRRPDPEVAVGQVDGVEIDHGPGCPRTRSAPPRRNGQR